MDILQFISAAGLGAVIATLLQSWLADKSANKKRNFQEKKEAYVGFLQSITESEISPSNENSLRAGHWINVCELVGSSAVRVLLSQHMETNPVDGKIHPDRPKVMKNLKDEMRKDLGVSI